jgi:SPOR domain
MIPFKGILKYLIYLFIAGWMFLLGIMVGRGTSPVIFDTQKFQKRLEIIANEFGGEKEIRAKMDLTFYDDLDKPVPEEGAPSKYKPLEIIPKKEMPEKEKIVVPDAIPLKTSLKKQTFKLTATSTKQDIGSENALKTDQGKYTLQIAAYKEFKDAVSQMADLEKKGFSSYRVRGQKQGVTWYRIRTGSFANFDEAEKFKERLSKAKVNSMIITKDKDEDINK